LSAGTIICAEEKLPIFHHKSQVRFGLAGWSVGAIDQP
jgi:hypothetical protein